MKVRNLLLMVPFALIALSGLAQDLTIAAASDLSFALPEIVARFEHQTGKKISLTFGSSGNFYQQLKNGAPFDVFFSADEQYPTRLEQEGVAQPGTQFPYAVGKIVLAAPNGSKFDLSKGLSVLLSPEIRRIAIANPVHAPYGRAAVEALQMQGIYDKVKNKLVLGENISQTAQFVQSGNAQAGIVALSLASAPSMRGSFQFGAIPDGDYQPIRQAAVITKASKHKETAETFLNFMRSAEIRQLMSQYGFGSTEPQKK